MSFAIGAKVIKRLCQEQNALTWQKAKLESHLFSAYEKPAFEWVKAHLKAHHALPQVQTLDSAFPDMMPSVEVVEPSSYYVKMLENKYFYSQINTANLASQQALKENQDSHDVAIEIMTNAIRSIKEQKYRNRIVDVGAEVPSMVLSTYHSKGLQDVLAEFGWDYMDNQGGGVMAGEVVSFIGRPAAGKTFLMLWSAIKNWIRGRNTLFVSMEMAPLPIAQRVAAMYTKFPLTQLKNSGFSSLPGHDTYKKFVSSLHLMSAEGAKFYVIDGNLAANVDDIFMLADMLGCKCVFIDGAYLVRHGNPRLDRFTRVSENAELIKRYSGDLDTATFASWQFSRKASEKKKGGQGDGEVGLEDIGLSDTIGQVSSIVVGLFQEDGVETIKQRRMRVLKGRSGEVGQFLINWDFQNMDFAEVVENLETKKLQWV